MKFEILGDSLVVLAILGAIFIIATCITGYSITEEYLDSQRPAVCVECQQGLDPLKENKR